MTHVTDPKIEHIFTYTVLLTVPPEVIGPVAEGIRVNFYLAGGEINGSRCKGKVLPVGADWILIRKDGVGLVDVRATLQMDDGALVYTAYKGVVDLGPDGYEAFLKGSVPPFFPIRIA